MPLHKSKPLPILSESDIAKFWSRVDKTPGHGPQGECWIWKGCRKDSGYGKFIRERKATKYSAHRIAYMLQHREDPGDLLVCHSCDFPPCVRGSHLFKGTCADNSGDAASKGRMASGDRSGSRLHPERLPRGQQHWFSNTKSPGRAKGAKNNNAKLTSEKVLEIRALSAQGRTGVQIADQFGISTANVSMIINNKTWLLH